MNKRREKIYVILFSIILAFICISINSTHSFLYKFMEGQDVHCFITTARCMLRGDVLYKDIYEPKGPLLYFLYVVALLINSNSFIGVFTLEVILFSVYIFFAYKIVALFVENTIIRYVLTVITGLITCSDVSFNGGGQCEELTLPFLCISMYIILKYFSQRYPCTIKSIDVFLIGCCFSVVFWMKYTLCGIYIGIIILIIVLQIKNKTVKKIFQYALIFILGFLFLSIPVIIYFLQNGGMKPLFDVYFYQVIFKYGQGGMKKLNLLDFFFDENIAIVHLPIMGCYIAAVLFSIFNKKYLKKEIRISIIVMIFSQLAGIAASYYWIYTMEATCMCSVLGVVSIYYIIYDQRENIKKCMKYLAKFLKELLDNKYGRIANYILIAIVLLLLVADKPGVKILTLIFSILLARILVLLQNKFIQKCKWIIIIKYILTFCLLFFDYEIIRDSIIFMILLFLIYDWNEYKKYVYWFGKLVRSKVNRKLLILICSMVSYIYIAVIGLRISPVSEYMYLDEAQYPQLIIGNYINNSQIEEPQILYWKCNDIGAYWLTKTYPPYRYIWFENLKSDTIKKEYMSGIKSGNIDFIISNEVVRFDNYELVYQGIRESKINTCEKYYLYEKNN